MTRETWLERNLGMVIAVVVVLMLIGGPILWSYWLAPTVFESNRQSGQEIAEESMDSDRAINNYRWFRTQWYDIQAQHQQTQNYIAEEEQFHETYGDDPTKWSRTAETRHGRLHARITGSENAERQMIADYNARSSDATRAIFECGLPYNVDEKLFIADASGVEYTSQEAMNKTPPESPEDCQFSEAPDPSDG